MHNRVKTYEAFLDADGKQNRTLFKDGTHPTDAGYVVCQKPELSKYVRGD
jgi:lysophospholipase L1-like esterase